MGSRMYLKVPYAEKDMAKKLGCKWDYESRRWWCSVGTDVPLRWLDPSFKVPEKEYIKPMWRENEVRYLDGEEFIFNGRHWYRQTDNLDIWKED